MTNAYDEIYLAQAQKVLGCMLDYAVHGIRMNLSQFYRLFLATGYAKRFGEGEADIVAGHSGIELAHMVLEKAGIPQAFRTPKTRRGRSREYWAGTALAYYQWSANRSFSEIQRFVPIADVLQMYHPYHEMDIRQFEDEMNRCITTATLKKETQLARLRAYAGLSQSGLAERAGVPVRTIQQYEQRQKDIRRAGAEQLESLSRALRCDTEKLMEG